MITVMAYDGPGRPLRSVSVPRPKLLPGEALVRVTLCTLCGSDLHTFFGRRTEPTPTVLGHEVVGTVDELGPGEPIRSIDGEPLERGDRVVWSVAASCGTCFFCTHDLPQKCERLVKYGHKVLAPDQPPLGGLTTHCHLVRGTAIVKVPDAVPDELAAPAMCATATVFAALRAGGLLGREAGKTVLVIGAGLLGLTATAAAGATVIVGDTDRTRLETAKSFGAAHTLHLPAEADRLNERTAGRGADVVLEMSGSPAAVELALTKARIGGTVVLVGSVSPTAPVAVRPEDVVRRCLTIRGVHNYTPQDLLAAVRWLAANHARFPFAGLVTRTFPLADADAAFHFAERERPVRVAVRP